MLSYALRPAPLSQATPGSAYTRERRLLASYAALLYAPTCDPEELMRQVWGPHLTPAQMYGSRAGNPGKIDRLDDEVPEAIKQLRPEEQEAIEALLLAGDLVGTVKRLLGHYRGGARRDTDPRLSEYKHEQTRAEWEEDPRQWHNDGWRIKAAGLGRLTREAYGRPLDREKPLVLTPPLVKLRVQGRTKRTRRVRFHHEPAGQLSFWG